MSGNDDDSFVHTDAIAAFALATLPAQYRLIGVWLDDGGHSPLLRTGKLEIRIEYVNTVKDDDQGTPEHIEVFQKWSEPIRQFIRSQWPIDAVTVVFSQKAGR